MSLGAGAGEVYDFSVVEVSKIKTWVVVVAALVVAYVLYWFGGKSIADYAVKLADFMMQGGIVTILFATLAKGLGVVLTRRR